MRLLFVADGHSPIALNWIAAVVRAGHEVHLASTFPCAPEIELASLAIIPVAFSGAGGMGQDAGDTGTIPRPTPAFSRFGFSSNLGLRGALRHWLGPLTVPGAASRLRKIVERVRPELVHALRLPFEGFLAAVADPAAPLLLSVWGNDFTLHAPASPGMAWLTRLALRRADGLHADCQRDLRLARQRGLPDGRPTIVLPGNGGVRREVFHPGPALTGDVSPALREALASIPQGAPVVVNPRGVRSYVRNDVFFRAAALVLAERPAVRFLCPAMLGEPEPERWVGQLRLRHAVRLLPRLSPDDMAAVFRRAQVTVSPSVHDGSPNTLLEAMACGCFPVAGDLESLREWIGDGENGLLTDPTNPRRLARAVLQALDDTALRRSAAERNARLIAERADHALVMAEAEAFYHRVLAAGRQQAPML